MNSARHHSLSEHLANDSGNLPFVPSPSELVKTAFAARIPVREEIVRRYEAGFCDQDSSYGEWLRAGQERLDNGPVDGELTYFCLEGVYSRALASNLIHLLTAQDDSYGSVDFVLQSAWMFAEDWRALEPGHDLQKGVDETFDDLTPAECAITLMALARLSRGPLFEWLDEHYGANLLAFGIRLRERAALSVECREPAKVFCSRFIRRVVTTVGQLESADA